MEIITDYLVVCFVQLKSRISIIIIITSSDDIQPSTLITDHSPSGLLLDMVMPIQL